MQHFQGAHRTILSLGRFWIFWVPILNNWSKHEQSCDKVVRQSGQLRRIGREFTKLNCFDEVQQKGWLGG